MTRYKLLKLIRDLLLIHLPGWQYDWMPRREGGYSELYVFCGEDARYRVEIKVEQLW